MPKVMLITSALAAAMLAAAPAALAQVTSGQEGAESPWENVKRDTGVVVGTDSAYIRQAIRGNYIEVALGRLAESRAEDSAVEEFAERMVSDHNDMNERWTELARDNDMSIGVDFGETGGQTIERFEDLDGAEFDQAYMAEMIRRHEQALALFQRMATSASSPEVRELADSGTSILQEHLALAREVGSSVGVSTTAGRAGGVVVPAPDTSDDRRRTTAGRTARDQRDDRDDRDDRGTLSAEDRAFVRNVLQDHLMHIRLAERAQREARDDETRRLADRIEEDFEDWQDRWEEVADRYDIRAPSGLGRLHGEKVERLEEASRGNVDRIYTVIVAEHLASVVPYFEKEGQAVGSAAVRRLVDDELPMIREYLARARRLQRQE